MYDRTTTINRKLDYNYYNYNGIFTGQLLKISEATQMTTQATNQPYAP